MRRRLVRGSAESFVAAAFDEDDEDEAPGNDGAVDEAGGESSVLRSTTLGVGLRGARRRVVPALLLLLLPLLLEAGRGSMSCSLRL